MKHDRYAVTYVIPPASSLPSPASVVLPHQPSTPDEPGTAKPADYCSYAAQPALANRRRPPRPGAAKSGNTAVVSWDPYDARKSA